MSICNPLAWIAGVGDWRDDVTLRDQLNNNLDWVGTLSLIEKADLRDLVWIEDCCIEGETRTKYIELPFPAQLLVLKRMQAHRDHELIWGTP